MKNKLFENIFKKRKTIKLSTAVIQTFVTELSVTFKTSLNESGTKSMKG